MGCTKSYSSTWGSAPTVLERRDDVIFDLQLYINQQFVSVVFMKYSDETNVLEAPIQNPKLSN